MTLVSILLALLIQEGVPQASSMDLVTVQARVSAAHRLFRETSRSAQRCDPQTATAASAANRLANEATQQRQQALSLMENDSQSAVITIPAGSIDTELGQAVDLLQRDMETSAAMLFKASPGGEPAAPALRTILSQASALPRVEELRLVVAAQGENGVALPPTLARDLAMEESLINAYFTAARIEIERVCLERPTVADDPFRVPARPAKPAAKSRKGTGQ